MKNKKISNLWFFLAVFLGLIFFGGQANAQSCGTQDGQCFSDATGCVSPWVPDSTCTGVLGCVSGTTGCYQPTGSSSSSGGSCVTAGNVCTGNCCSGLSCIASGGVFTCQTGGGTGTLGDACGATTGYAVTCGSGLTCQCNPVGGGYYCDCENSGGVTPPPGYSSSSGGFLPASNSPVVRDDIAAALHLSTSTIPRILYNLLLWLLGIVGILGVIGFTISGILYLVSVGDSDRIELAKKAMTYSIVGTVVALLGLSITLTIWLMLNH